MSEKTPAQKLGLKPGMTAALLHLPNGLLGTLQIPDEVTVVTRAAGADFILEFATDQAQAEGRLAALRSSIGEKTVTWLAYPKGSKAAGHDISRDTVWGFVRSIGLTLNANVAIDETWSAVRMRPLKDAE